MSATDDISGPWGPLGDIALFGQCKHGMVTREPSAYLAPVVYTLHLPNGTTEPYKGPDLLYNNGPDGFDYSYGYGRGGSNYYWQRPGIAPVSRTPEQLAEDVLLGHEWRNDRANSGWFWCDGAGDRWHVSISQAAGGGGLSKNYTVTLKQAGLIGAHGVTRSTVVTVTDPNDKPLPDDFLARGDSSFHIALQDINSDGSRAAYGIMRKPYAPVFAPDSHTFELFRISREQADMFAIPPHVQSYEPINEPAIPPYVATSYLEIVLSGSVLSETWNATAVTALTRTQTAGTYTYSAAPAHQEVAVWTYLWNVAYDPPTPDYQQRTLTPLSTVVTLGSWDSPPGFPRGVPEDAYIKTIEGSGEYAITGRAMVVGVMYKRSGSLAVITTDVDYSYTYHSTATGSQSGSRVERIYPFATVRVSDDRTFEASWASGNLESTSWRIKVDGVQVFEDLFTLSYEYSYSVGYALGPDYLGNQTFEVMYRTSAGIESAAAGSSTLSQPFDHTAEAAYPIYPLPWGSDPFGPFDPQFFRAHANEMASWQLRTGVKSMRSVNPSPPANRLSTPPGGLRTALWNANLARPSNACFQYRLGASKPFVVWRSWAVVGPVITADGATTGQYFGNPGTPNFDPLPPIHVARSPFTGDVVQSVFAVNFV